MSNNFYCNTKYSLALRNSEFLKYYCNKSSKSKNTAMHNNNNNISNILKDTLSLNSKTSSVNLTYNASGKNQKTNSVLLQAENNVLTLDSSKLYKAATGSNGFTTLAYDEYGTGSIYDSSDESYPEVNKLCRFVSSLIKDSSGFDVYANFSNDETKELLTKLGIKCGGYFEITNGSTTNKFYVREDGFLNGEYQINAQRDAFNSKNWFKDGYTQDSTFIIDGNEYKLDETGHLHIPNDVPCVQGNFKLIK